LNKYSGINLLQKNVGGPQIGKKKLCGPRKKNSAHPCSKQSVFLCFTIYNHNVCAVPCLSFSKIIYVLKFIHFQKSSDSSDGVTIPNQFPSCSHIAHLTSTSPTRFRYTYVLMGIDTFAAQTNCYISFPSSKVLLLSNFRAAFKVQGCRLFGFLHLIRIDVVTDCLCFLLLLDLHPGRVGSRSKRKHRTPF